MKEKIINESMTLDEIKTVQGQTRRYSLDEIKEIWRNKVHEKYSQINGDI